MIGLDHKLILKVFIGLTKLEIEKPTKKNDIEKNATEECVTENVNKLMYYIPCITAYISKLKKTKAYPLKSKLKTTY